MKKFIGGIFVYHGIIADARSQVSGCLPHAMGYQGNPGHESKKHIGLRPA
jgi:hypothetical protein